MMISQSARPNFAPAIAAALAHDKLLDAHNALIPVANRQALDELKAINGVRRTVKEAIDLLGPLDVPLSIENATSGIEHLNLAAGATSDQEFRLEISLGMSAIDVAAEGVANAFDLFD